MKNILPFLLSSVCIFLINTTAFSQEEKISIKDIHFEETAILFIEYKALGKNCVNKNGIAKHCFKEEKLLDNNLEELQLEMENTLSYLNIKNELISEERINKEIYKDKSFYRYVIRSVPKISTKGNSCFSNPGALIFHYLLEDRLENKTYSIALDYAFYICDIQILVNNINKNLKKAQKKSAKN